MPLCLQFSVNPYNDGLWAVYYNKDDYSFAYGSNNCGGRTICGGGSKSDFPLDFGTTGNKLYNFDANAYEAIPTNKFKLSVKDYFREMQPNPNYRAGENFVLQFTGEST